MVAIVTPYYLATTVGGVVLCLHAWRLGPAWLGWAFVAYSFLYYLLVTACYFIDDNGDEMVFADHFYILYTTTEALFLRRWTVNGPSEAVAIGVVAVGAVAGLLLSSLVGQHYLGWIGGIGLVVLASAALSILRWYGGRRVRESSNPLRGLLELDDLAAQGRNSVIAI
jgi:Trk-type K+ transport system membrane component